MDLDIIQDIREMMHGLAEKKQRKDTVAIIQSVLFKQMALLIYKATQNPKKRKIKEITVKDIIFILKNNKNTLIRMLRVYLLKGSMHKFTSVTSMDKPELEDIEESKPKKQKLSNSDVNVFDSAIEITEATADYEFSDTPGFDLISSWAANNTQNDECGSNKKPNIYKSITETIKEFKIDVDLTKEEDVRNATDPRKIKADKLAILLSPTAYECFQICRTRTFHNKKGELLLNKVQKALPFVVRYNLQAEDVFLYLAKETIATLIDRVHQNRKKILSNEEETQKCPETLNPNNTKVKQLPITVDEITDITTAVWKRPLDCIQIPFTENDEFFNSDLIFD
ncbi:uncharacterized protein LOC126838952 [Adelges cooleyi]|uniref:uncharacterized protein LOC126838952 n=1 Tax=Adelges cooleyi TaxID=133065 RepID=UPI00217F6CC9|nr:uncharacterized protein LOC126838952 [Adelges cooleyi]